MQTVTTIGLDIAKSVFQVHGVDAAGWLSLERRYVPAFFQKLPPCLVLGRPPSSWTVPITTSLFGIVPFAVLVWEAGGRGLALYPGVAAPRSSSAARQRRSFRAS